MPRRRIARNPLFSGRQFADEVVTLCVRWYLRFKLSYQDVAEIAWETGILVAPSTYCAGSFDMRRSLLVAGADSKRPVGGSWRADESYLSRTRDIAAAKAFFRKALKHHGEPRSITLDGFEPSHAALRRMGMRNEFNFR
jgi:transposase-like protein